MGRGAHYINFSPAVKPDGQPMSESELDTEAYQLNRMGDDIAPAGLDLMVHHHGAEMPDNAREWRYLLAHTELKLGSEPGKPDRHYRPPPPRAAPAQSKNSRDQQLFRDGDIDIGQVERLLHQMQYDGRW